MVGWVVRSLYARRSSSAPPHERTLAVLVGARALVERGWVQGAWYVLEAPDGRRRAIGAGSLTRRSFGEIVQSCLVGAVIESARWHTAERGAAGPAIDTVWQELGELSGGRPPVDPRTPMPVLRSRQVGELTSWNDCRDRSRDDVVRLLDAAIARMSATAVPAPRPAPEPAPDPSGSPASVGTGS